MLLYNISSYPSKRGRKNLLKFFIFSGILIITLTFLKFYNSKENITNQIKNSKNIKIIHENNRNLLLNSDKNGSINDNQIKYTTPDDDYILNYKGGELEPEWQWVKNISIIYTWVDGSDTDFLEEKSKYYGGERDINSRFRSADELRYSIRSVEKYLPWHEGNIYILTAQQIPHWLNTENSRIKVVFHKDVIPEYVTPTYDSGTIELYLDKIPGITEQFLFFNDDVFLNNYVHPAFFFTTKEHYPKIYLERLVTFNMTLVQRELKRNDIHRNFYTMSYHTDLIIKKYFDSKFKYYYLEHTVHVFYRDLMEPFRQLFENELKVVTSDRFRNPHEPHTLYLFLMFQYYATQHSDFPKKFGGKGKAKYFKGYKLPKDRTIQKYSAVLNYPEEHEGRIKFGKIDNNIKENNDRMIYYKTHPEILIYNFNDKYTKENALYQLSEYMITRYPWPSSFEKKEYVELENNVLSQLKEIEKLEEVDKIENTNNFEDTMNKDIDTNMNDDINIIEDTNNMSSEELLEQPLFKKKLNITKEYLNKKDSFIVESKMSTREKEEIESLKNYSKKNEKLSEEWNWVENISMVYIFDKDDDIEIKKLIYSIQSLINYLPWFKGKIFIVALNEKLGNKLESSFKNENYYNQIEILTSDKIVPRRYRKYSNINTVEMYMDKIPDISERFIYLNQNQYFIKKTHPRLFFSNKEFFPKYNLMPALTRREKRSKHINKAFYRTFRLIELYYSKSYVHHWRYLKNAPCPLYRDLFEPVRQAFKDHLKKSFTGYENHQLLPLYLVVNYNIYATAQVNYPNYVGGYGKIKDIKAPSLNSKRTIKYYGFEETSLFVNNDSMITDLNLNDNLCNHIGFKKRISNDNILFFSISNEIENKEDLDVKFLSPYFDDKCSFSNKVKVSVILPTYNSAQFLNNSINAILNQTLKEIELIIINDASTDNTVEILKKYENDDRVTIINLKNNGGIGRGRNIGIAIAKGEFIGFMDADDFVDERFFESLYKKSNNKDVVIGYLLDCISHSYHCAHNKEQEDYDRNLFNKRKSKKRAYGFVNNSIWRKKFLYKKNLKFSLKRGVLEDKLFRNECYSKNPRLKKVSDDGIYYYYERRMGSANPNNENKWLNTIFEKGEKEKIINRGRIVDSE